VLPISEAVLALYASRLVTDIEIASSGTGGGFQKFCQKQTAITGASRPITATEMKFCESNDVEYIELPVAFDGIAVVVHHHNTFMKSMTVQELKKLWETTAEGNLMQWNDLRAGLPDERIFLAGPGLKSGTFDFFTRAVIGAEHASRSDYKASEDDRELVEFVAKTPGALGYFGLAYYTQNRARLRAVAIDDGVPNNGDGAIAPNPETVANATYQPLSRPVFLYVNASDAQRAEVRDFVEFYLRAARLVAPDVGYVALPDSAFKLAQTRLEQNKTGSIFDGEPILGLTIEELMQAETVASREAGPSK
jgi:phosphate transport system substrate-binding protein